MVDPYATPCWTPQQLAALSPTSRAIHLACPEPGLCFAESGVIEGARCGPCEAKAGLACRACRGTALEAGAFWRGPGVRDCQACYGTGLSHAPDAGARA